MDPGTIIALVQITAFSTLKAVEYIQKVRSSDRDRASLRAETQALASLLEDLKDDAEAAVEEQDWALLSCLPPLKAPLEVFKQTMDEICLNLDSERDSSLQKSLRNAQMAV